MLNKLIAKYLGYPIQDLVKGTNIINELSFLRKSQYWDEDRIYEYQLKKLRGLISYSKKNVPYYDDLFKKIKITKNDIKTLNDINKIPILTKEIMRKNGNKLLSRNYKKYKLKKGKTGGTTGVPVLVYKDTANRSFTWASYYRWYDWMGIHYSDKILTFWGANTVLSESLISKLYSNLHQSFQNEIFINSFKMNESDMEQIANIIFKNKPVCIKGYLSAIIKFAEFVDRKKYSFTFIRAISTTTETLLPHNRKYIESIFNAPVFDQYGCGEVSSISFECAQHNGLHINQEHVICEVLDNNDQPIINSTGRVVATDLDNYVMPFIRFETGDMATLSNEKCSCGIKHPLMKSIEGRSIDTIVLKDGNHVHGVFFTDILYELNILADQIQRFQIYQEIPGSIEFRIERIKGLEVSTLIKIKNVFLNFLNEVKVIEMDELPLSKSGKFSYIVNNI